MQRSAEEPEKALEAAVESAGHLREEHFARERGGLPKHSDGTTCDKCTTGLNSRFGCARCTSGAIAEQEPHDGPRVCRRHRRWVGPGTAPGQQFQVSKKVMTADREYSRLRRDGVLDAHRLAELLGCVSAWSSAEIADPLDPSEQLVVAVQVAKVVLSPAALEKLRSRRRPPEERYASLSVLVAHIVAGQPHAVLVDALWLLIRTIGIEGAGHVHAFAGAPDPEHTDYSADFALLSTCSYPRELDRHLSQFVASEFGGSRFNPSRVSRSRNTYLCVRGHRFTATKNVMRTARASGCPYCSGKRPLVGFNTLADAHPRLAEEWHPTANGALAPTEVTAGSGRRVTWMCNRGHSWTTQISARTSGSGCAVCANQRVDPDFNSLAITHPEIAAEWHPTKNGSLTPADVVAGSTIYRWWQCAEGHEWRSGPSNRRRGGCAVCGRRACRPETSLAATHPEIAASWHPTMNGEMSPKDILSGSGKSVWWLCGAGHPVLKSVANRVRGLGAIPLS